MPTERGIVIKSGGETAWVKVLPSEACEQCSAHGSCAGQRGEMEVEVLNPMGAQVGDRIVVDMETASLLKASFLLYVFPIICMIAGATIGVGMAGRLGLDDSAMSATLGLGAFAVSVLFIKYKGNRMARHQAYRPRITKILR
ncbi:MAG: SoxR reducing system RseC family protein [Desulfobacterales bacterium]